MSIFFGIQGASEIVLGVKNMFIGSLTPVPVDRNQKNFFFHIEKNFRKNTFFDFLGIFLENRAKFRKSKIFEDLKIFEISTQKKTNFFSSKIFDMKKNDQDFFNGSG